MACVSTRKAWLLYSTIRIGMFAVAFALLFWIGAAWWLAAVLAGLISAALSVLFLDRFRSQAATGIQEWRDRDRTADDIVEDDSIEADPSLLTGFTQEQPSSQPASSRDETSSGSDTR